MVAGLVAGYPERATDRRFESYPFRSFHRCAHASKGVSILDSLAELSMAEVSSMLALPSIFLHNGCDVWPRRFSLRLPRSVRLSADGAGSHLTFLGMAASLLKKEMNSPCRGLVGEHISDPEPDHACHGWQGDMSLAF